MTVPMMDGTLDAADWCSATAVGGVGVAVAVAVGAGSTTVPVAGPAWCVPVPASTFLSYALFTTIFGAVLPASIAPASFAFEDFDFLRCQATMPTTSTANAEQPTAIPTVRWCRRYCCLRSIPISVLEQIVGC